MVLSISVEKKRFFPRQLFTTSSRPGCKKDTKYTLYTVGVDTGLIIYHPNEKCITQLLTINTQNTKYQNLGNVHIFYLEVYSDKNN